MTGDAHQVIASVAPIWRDAARTARDRELVFGERFRVERAEAAMVFGRAARDGYAGWLDAAHLTGRAFSPTHRIAVPRSHALLSERPLDDPLHAAAEILPLSFDARLHVTGAAAPGWVRIDPGRDGPLHAYVPQAHLGDVSPMTDPVAVAELFLGTPYLWGGNSAFGIDCSGLVQIACLACGITCPGDSHQQEAELGAPVADLKDLRRGDLMFWKGHVAWVADETRILHANAHYMAVTHEDRMEAIRRIDAQGGGPVTALKRLPWG